jgi:hypothetical protein
MELPMNSSEHEDNGAVDEGELAHCTRSGAAGLRTCGLAGGS